MVVEKNLSYIQQHLVMLYIALHQDKVSELTYLIHSLLHLNFCYYLADFLTENILTGNDFFNLGIQNSDVNDLSGVRRFNIGAYRKVIIVLLNLIVRNQTSKVVFVFTTGVFGNDIVQIFGGQFIIVCDLDNRYFSDLVTAIEAEGAKRGYTTAVLLSHRDKTREIECIETLYAMGVSGICLCPINKGEDFERFMLSLNMPVVTVGNRLSGVTYVGIDNFAAVGETVDALTGATVTSKAVVRCINSAVAYVTGADATTAATSWGG